MNEKQHIQTIHIVVLFCYIVLVIACYWPHVRWCSGGNRSSDPLWLRQLQALLMIPSLPLMLMLGFHPNKTLVLTLEPIYLACIFWPMPLFALKPAVFRRPCVRRVAIGYIILFLAGCGAALWMIFVVSPWRWM